LNITQTVVQIIDDSLGLNGRATTFTRNTVLLGSVAELDSMGVVALIASLEDHFGLLMEDEDMDGATFATVGTLVDFVNEKLAV
jgi:acyl carrier protein